MIGIERGWRLRREKAGTRVAGVRTYTLVGTGGALGGILAQLIHPLIAAAVAFSIGALLVVGYVRDSKRRDTTSAVAAIVALGLGLLAGAGQPALAVAGAAVVTLLLATRTQSHRFVSELNSTDVQAFARFAVIAAAVLPFLPNRNLGPLDAWNPFQLWLIVLLITGFSFAGYIASRTIGQRKGVLAAAVIGGAYSSTAVTASFSQRLGAGEEGPLTAGILIATAVMYLRVMLLVGVLSPSTVMPFILVTAPAALTAWAAAAIAWFRAPRGTGGKELALTNPIELLPALGFTAIVAAGVLATRWAQGHFGRSGVAGSLFITGTFNVDAAIVTLSGLPVEAIDRQLAALALAGTIIANTLLKLFVAGTYARSRSGGALAGLGASTLVLAVTVGLGLARRFGAL
jgi:uncharacterized membrane protein (DUF4010 family)